MDAGWIADVSGEGQTTLVLSALQSVDDSADQGAVDLRAEFGDDEGRIVLACTLLGKVGVCIFLSEETDGTLATASNRLLNHRITPHLAMTSLAASSGVRGSIVVESAIIIAP